jgi:Mg2+-importing ATPase
VDDEHLRSAQRWDVSDLRRYMLVFGLTSTVFDLLTFGLLLKVFDAGEALFQTAWFVVSLLTELAVLLVLRTRLPLWRSRPGTLLWASTAAVAVLAIALPYSGAPAWLFGLVPLPGLLLGSLLAVVLGYAAATEWVKQRFYERHAKRPRPARRRHRL